MNSSKEERLDECIEHHKEFRRFRNRIITEIASIMSNVNNQELEKTFKLTTKVSDDLTELENECVDILKKEFGEDEIVKRLSYNLEIMSLNTKV